MFPDLKTFSTGIQPPLPTANIPQRIQKREYNSCQLRQAKTPFIYLSFMVEKAGVTFIICSKPNNSREFEPCMQTWG